MFQKLCRNPNIPENAVVGYLCGPPFRGCLAANFLRNPSKHNPMSFYQEERISWSEKNEERVISIHAQIEPWLEGLLMGWVLLWIGVGVAIGWQFFGGDFRVNALAPQGRHEVSVCDRATRKGSDS